MSFEGECAFKVCADQLVRDESFADEFVCKICQVHVVGCAPQLTKCSHLFCGDCLEQWFIAHPSNQSWAQRAKTDGAVPCPVCKTMLRKESDLYPVEEHGNANSRLLWQMIQGLHIKCGAKHHDCAGGCCNWKGTYGSYLEHLQSGTCGTCESDVTDTQQKDETSILFDEFTKERSASSSVSTCSEIVSVPALEEMSTDFSSEECSLEDEYEADNFAISDPTCTDELLREFGDNSPASDPACADEFLNFTSEDCSMCGTEGAEPIEGVQTVVPTMAPNEPSRNTTAKGNKGKKKKQKNAQESTAHDSKFTCSQLMQGQWQQAYQWRYQMACAQQYQVAVQTLRMQQYYQQLHMSAIRH